MSERAVDLARQRSTGDSADPSPNRRLEAWPAEDRPEEEGQRTNAWDPADRSL